MMTKTFLVEKELENAQYRKREEPWLHIPYEYELVLLNMVKNGDTNRIRDVLLRFDLRNHLSSNNVRQRRYELIAIITLITRWAVEGGLDVETAYDLADAYINMADKSEDNTVIMSLIKEAPIHFAALVRDNRIKHRLTKPVLQCMEYIESNLHSAISVNQLATHVGKNASYLSTIFKKETNISISAYIRKKKLDAAKQLLANTDMPISQIAETLAFCTQSYFTAVFVKEFGETPQQFRKHFFRLHRLEGGE